MSTDYQIYELENFDLQSGQSLPMAKLAYKTYGKLNEAKNNVVVLPTFYTGSHMRNEGFFGAGRAIDPDKHFIVSVNLFGNGLSSSPSNTLKKAPPTFQGYSIPNITLFDNIRAQHQLLTEELDVTEIALVAGWSMAGCQAYQWAAQYPAMVKAICLFVRQLKHLSIILFFLKASKQRCKQMRSMRMEIIKLHP